MMIDKICAICGVRVVALLAHGGLIAVGIVLPSQLIAFALAVNGIECSAEATYRGSPTVAAAAAAWAEQYFALAMEYSLA